MSLFSNVRCLNKNSIIYFLLNLSEVIKKRTFTAVLYHKVLCIYKVTSFLLVKYISVYSTGSKLMNPFL